MSTYQLGDTVLITAGQGKGHKGFISRMPQEDGNPYKYSIVIPTLNDGMTLYKSERNMQLVKPSRIKQKRTGLTKYQKRKINRLIGCAFAVLIIAVLLVAIFALTFEAQAKAAYASPEPIESPALEIVMPSPNPSQQGKVTYLSDADRTEIEQTVMAEAGGEPYDGQMLIAQCILDASKRDGISPVDVLAEYRYTPCRVKPSESVQDAVSAVFDCGERVTGEETLYFANMSLCDGTFHRQQNYVIKVGAHTFYN